MRLAPPAQISVRSRQQPAKSELLLRYAAAYSCTLIAVLAAQLYISNPLALILGVVTLLGLPISLYLRWSNLRVFGIRIPRLLLNSVMMLITGFSCFYLLMVEQPELFSRSLYHSLLLSQGAGDAIATLMKMFLVFAVIRSLVIINDKDAVLSAVPSFSVLLLLIVVHRGPAVVAYFLLWSHVAATLFTLDHRHESRQALNGIIPSLEPGQDIRLSARGLATVMGFSLACAVVLSYFASSRDPEDRGQLESWILGMAGRVTQLALNIPEVSINSGPEREISFASGPALPTKAELWRVQALSYNWEPIQPEYWRMFTLSKYNGATWSQPIGFGSSLPRELLSDKQWPRLRYPQKRLTDQPNRPQTRRAAPATPSTPARQSAKARSTPGSARSSSPTNNPSTNNPASKTPSGRTPSTPKQTTNNRPNGNSANNQQPMPRYRRMGFSVASRHPYGQRILNSFGGSPHSIIQIIQPLTANIGFAPVLPAVSAVRVRGVKQRNSIRARQDGAIDIGVIQPGEMLLTLSSVSPGDQYGFGRKLPGPPLLKTAKKANPNTYLSPVERRGNLSLPKALLQPDSRIKQLAKQVLSASPFNESDYGRARRLAQMVQNRAVYTLRPPAIPASVDAAEYFLFESRRGYCTYFAGALTVLCRASGIPARVVSGFVNPEWTSKDQPGILREENAHAWTEVWVEGWGWTSLDATPPENRGENAPGWWQNWQDLFATTFDATKFWVKSHLTFLSAIALLLSAFTCFLLLRSSLVDPLRAHLHRVTKGRIKLNHDHSRRLIFKAYERAAKKLARRFRRRVDWETPSEWLASAEATLALENPKPLRDLTRLFLQAEYSPRAISDEEGVAAYEALKNLSWKTRRIQTSASEPKT